MSVEAALVSRLEAAAGVAALVATRIHPLVLPQGTELPALTYQRIDNRPVSSLQGSSGLAVPVFQVSCWSRSYSQARDLAEAVRLALQGFVGEIDSICLSIVFEGDRDLYDDETEMFHVPMDFRVAHEEPVPS